MLVHHLTDQAQHSLDSMHELLEITHDTTTGVYLYHSQNFLLEHDSNRPLSNLKITTDQYYLNWLNDKASKNEKQLMSLALFTGSKLQIEQLYENVSYGLFTGSETPFWWIDTFIEHVNILAPYFSKKPRLEIFKPYLIKNDSIEIFNVDYIRSNIIIKKTKNLKETKKALIKGINMFKNLFGSDMITSFINGNSFIIEGKYYNYRFKKTSSLLVYTANINSYNIQYDLEIIDKKTDIIYGKLCTVFKDTPIIDQIISIILFIQNGEEDKILKHTNVFNKSEHFYSNDHYLKPAFHKRIINNDDSLTAMNSILEDINNKHNSLKEFQKKNSRQICNDIHQRLKSNIEKFDMLEYMINPKLSFDEILDLASIYKNEIRLHLT